jgi:excinuclease ABC subunit C
MLGMPKTVAASVSNLHNGQAVEVEDNAVCLFGGDSQITLLATTGAGHDHPVEIVLQAEDETLRIVGDTVYINEKPVSFEEQAPMLGKSCYGVGHSPLIADFYDTQSAIPPQVMLDFPLSDEDLDLLSEYLTLLAGHKVHVRIPERGDGRRLCDLALENAAEAARQYRLENEREDKHVRRLSELLGLPERPARIECYDISNIGRESIVGAMIVYEGGRYKKNDYRLFSVKGTDGPDDYASMKEVLTRRLSHIGDGTASLGTAPDLILLDGGEAHVHVGQTVLTSFGLDIPLFGMVKDDYHKTRAITDGAREISIAQEASVYTFIYKMQEEVHRFAITSSQNNKRKTLRTSTLERIAGIGPAKARRLLSAMPLGELRHAEEETLRAIDGISAADAKAVYTYFHKNKK